MRPCSSESSSSRRHGTPLERLAHFIAHIERGESLPLARLWLNARHLSRFSPALDEVLQEQDELDRERLIAIIEDGIASGEFPEVDAETACIRILIAVDGGGSYVNSTADDHPPRAPSRRGRRRRVGARSETGIAARTHRRRELDGSEASATRQASTQHVPYPSHAQSSGSRGVPRR